MSASTSDKFLEVGNPGSATNLAGAGYTIGAASITVDTTTNWPTATLVIFGIDVVETDANGEEVRVEGSYCIFEGIVTSSTTIGSVTKLFGDDQDYAAGATTRVYITVSTQQTKKLVDGLVVEHNRDGTHSDITADSLQLPSGVQIKDENTNEMLRLYGGASVVNNPVLQSSATGSPVLIYPEGDDTNIRLNLVGKGSGEVQFNGVNASGAWESWTPSYTNFTLGNGTLEYAKYKQIGKTVFFKIKVTLGSTSSMGSAPLVTLPVTAADVSVVATTWGEYNDATGGTYPAFVRINSGTTTQFRLGYLNATPVISNASATAPFTWTTNDHFIVTGIYEAA